MARFIVFYGCTLSYIVAYLGAPEVAHMHFLDRCENMRVRRKRGVTLEDVRCDVVHSQAATL